MKHRLKELARLLMNAYQDVLVAILKLFGRLDFPVPKNSNMRRTSAKTIRRYVYSGTTTYLPIAVAAQLNGMLFQKGTRVLDFGCGVAGQLRLFTKNLPDATYYATDVDPSSVSFVQENYPQVTAGVNRSEPPLEYQRDFFDLVYTVSTFSHFDGPGVDAWLAELSRVLKPGGLLIATIEGEKAAGVVAMETGDTPQQIRDDISRTGIYYKNYSWLGELKSRGAALSPSVDISSYFASQYGNTVMSIPYFAARAGQFGLAYINHAAGASCDRQDVVIFRKT